MRGERDMTNVYDQTIKAKDDEKDHVSTTAQGPFVSSHVDPSATQSK